MFSISKKRVTLFRLIRKYNWKAMAEKRLARRIAPVRGKPQYDEETKKMMEKRRYIINEIYETENSYMNFLMQLITVFQEPMEKKFQDKPAFKEFSNAIFTTITEIRTYHWV